MCFIVLSACFVVVRTVVSVCCECDCPVFVVAVMYACAVCSFFNFFQ